MTRRLGMPDPRDIVRARACALFLSGCDTAEIAARLGCSEAVAQVARWRRRDMVTDFDAFDPLPAALPVIEFPAPVDALDPPPATASDPIDPFVSALQRETARGRREAA